MVWRIPEHYGTHFHQEHETALLVVSRVDWNWIDVGYVRGSFRFQLVARPNIATRLKAPTPVQFNIPYQFCTTIHCKAESHPIPTCPHYLRQTFYATFRSFPKKLSSNWIRSTLGLPAGHHSSTPTLCNLHDTIMLSMGRMDGARGVRKKFNNFVPLEHCKIE